ncbi:peptidoglycan D,D-transpeptidase FtsI family protein [Planctomicrobium sp. SH668]|uniref:peptidoglycan D,D-transpeptidase FtsI family protein n=1 Tax=Planctomicrobium sp. SH668 TaxID=3448126 RepID=UPI003F5B80E6
MSSFKSILNAFGRRFLSRWIAFSQPDDLEPDDGLADFEKSSTTPPDADGMMRRHHEQRISPLVYWLQRSASRQVSSTTRETVILWGVVIAACVIAMRFAHIQWIRGDHYAARAVRQQLSSEPILARPGDLYDRRGRLLATTISVPSLFIYPNRISDIPGLSQKLADALGMDAVGLQARIEANSTKQFLWIKRRLDETQAAAIRELEISPRLLGFRREFQRHYPQGHLAAHVLGIRNIDGVGVGGIEEFLDEKLKGADGVRRFVRDARGYVLNILEDVTEPPIDGTSYVLTIDAILQLKTEQQLDALMDKHQALGACAIVMDPQNGEVLAMASRPAFDPNHPERASPDAWKNMSTSAVFEPGSTFKPLVVAWALDHGLIERDQDYDCENGVYRMGKRLLHDHHPYGVLSLTDVLVKSSNIGMAKIGETLGNDRLYDLARAFGFGKKTGIELPGELAGILRSREKWNHYSTGSIPMGQELAATPLQILVAHSVLANHGLRVSPHLILDVTTKVGSPRPTNVLMNRIVGSESADWVVQGPMLEIVERGTGKQAYVSGRDIFGKTGTAQKLAEDGQSYSQTRNFSSFVGGADADAPRLMVLVSVDEPRGTDQFGGSVAAPYVAEILKSGMEIVQKEKVRSPEKAASELELIAD